VKRDSIPLPIEPVLDARAAARAWRHAGAALLFTVAWILACYAKTAAGMVEIWTRSETFAHGSVDGSPALSRGRRTGRCR